MRGATAAPRGNFGRDASITGKTKGACVRVCVRVLAERPWTARNYARTQASAHGHTHVCAYVNLVPAT